MQMLANCEEESALNTLAFLDILVVTLYLVLIMLVGFYFVSRYPDTPENYFLAGRKLGWLAIGTSIFAANISSEHFIGLAGYGASKGLAVGNFEWMAIFALMLLGWCLAPIFIKTNIFTVPEFFGKRFNNASRLYLSGISILAYLLTKISISLFAGGLLLREILGWDIYTSAIVLMVLTGIYTIMGGLSAAVYTAMIQTFFLIGGALVMTGYGLHEMGGFSGLQQKLPAEYFSVFKPLSDPDFPWLGIVFGAPILAVWYWCTDQYIVQRILGAKDVTAARNGAILTGFLKILPMFFLVLPGLIAAAMFPGVRGDMAYASLFMSSLLPVGLKGLVLAGLLSALMSSLSACFISTSTLFTMDFYRTYKPDASDKKLVLVGRLATIAIVFLGILWIPLMRVINTHIYVYLQSVQAYIGAPIAAVFLLGVFWKRMNGNGALTALVLGGLLGLVRLVLESTGLTAAIDMPLLHTIFTMNFLYFAIFLFIFSGVVMAAVSILTTAPYPQMVKELIVSPTTMGFEVTTISPAYLAREKRTTQILSMALVCILVGLWGIFF